MAELDPLIRLYKKTVDDKQRVLADLYRTLEELEQRKQAMLDEVASESKAVEDMNSLDTQSFFGAYAAGMRKKISRVDDELQKMELLVDAAREDVREGFTELKKVELTAEARAEAEAKKNAKKDSDIMDEIGIDAFRRQQEED
jgi:flagellar export protein FliJ|tara:strand:+ start:271086 stop:271514 length:429 start_codon:yes stop_codon:yes gene_type:complete